MDEKILQDENPCVSCGLCCSNFRVSFYHGEIEGMPMGFVPVNMVEKLTESRACMKGTSQKNPRCIALKGTLGEHVSCSIYVHRPTPCREFNVWEDDGTVNERCLSLRKAAGLPLIHPASKLLLED
jgi:uncharacterized protein